MAAKRCSIYVDGLAHQGQPIPNAARIGNIVWSGGIHGIAPNATSMPEDEAAEATQMFANLRAIVEAGGATVDDVIRVSITVSDRSAARDAINQAWVALFPDEDSRPARHVAEHALPQPLRMQCECIAVIDDRILHAADQTSQAPIT
jgi:enamine deaminase RidA (YjgF/YER057c/UK114 family)